MNAETRSYELIVFGASGFTGLFTAEAIVKNLPTNLKWAVAGRSPDKLEALVRDLTAEKPDRVAPGIEVCGLDRKSLNELAKKTRVLISTVGPYAQYGEEVVAACAQHGTHYLDVTGETPWVLDMIKKYDAKAKETGAVMIPQIGIESCPADLLTWALVDYAKQNYAATTAEVVSTVHDMKARPSGGTLATVLGIFDKYTPSQVGYAHKPWSACPISPTPSNQVARPITEKLLGVRVVPDLGTVTTSVQGATDRTVVHRSWGLFGGSYGPRFYYSPYSSVRNAFVGVLAHFALTLGMMSLLLPPVRAILKKLVYQAGQGPTRDESRNDHIEWRAISHVDSKDADIPKRIRGRFEWRGSLYDFTGVSLAEAAMTILRDDTVATREKKGGFLTPATLGASFLQRLQKAGVQFDIRVLE